MKTIKIDFDQRTDDEAITYEGGAGEVAPGCKVSLRKDGVDVLARITELTTTNECVGEVTGYEGDETVENLAVGSTIRFQQEHIFRCAA